MLCLISVIFSILDKLIKFKSWSNAIDGVWKYKARGNEKASNLHGTTFPYKGRIYFILQIIKLLSKIPLWSSGLNLELLAEWNPLPSKFRGLREGFKSEHGSTIIWDIACNFVDWIIYWKDGENRVCCDKWRFLHGINCTYKYVYISQIRWLPFFLIPENEF